jgi:hypothetical protein
MQPIVIIPTLFNNYEYSANIFMNLIQDDYDITIDSDFDKSIIDRIKYYDNYIIIQVDSNNVYINNEKNNISEFSNNFRNIIALLVHRKVLYK